LATLLEGKGRQLRGSAVSQYLLEIAEAGLVPLSSVRRRERRDATFHREELSKEFQVKLLGDLARLAVDMNFIRVQLIHDYRAPIQSDLP
jgi:hypothetical protein